MFGTVRGGRVEGTGWLMERERAGGGADPSVDMSPRHANDSETGGKRAKATWGGGGGDIRQP